MDFHDTMIKQVDNYLQHMKNDQSESGKILTTDEDIAEILECYYDKFIKAKEQYIDGKSQWVSKA